MITFKDLVISITGYLQITISKSLIQRACDGLIFNLFFKIVKDIMKSLGLILVIAEKVIGNSCCRILIQGINQQIELFVECGLRKGVEADASQRFFAWSIFNKNRREIQ